MQSELQLPGYTISFCLWRKAGRAAYRARRLSDGADVCIETLDTEYPDRRQVATLNHEASIASRLDGVKGVRRVHDILPHGSGNLALITDPCERSLASVMAESRNRRLPLPQTLKIAQTLVQMLSDIHAQDIVHKSLTPHNVLFDSRSGALVLSGFNIA